MEAEERELYELLEAAMEDTPADQDLSSSPSSLVDGNIAVGMDINQEHFYQETIHILLLPLALLLITTGGGRDQVW